MLDVAGAGMVIPCGDERSKILLPSLLIVDRHFLPKWPTTTRDDDCVCVRVSDSAGIAVLSTFS